MPELNQTYSLQQLALFFNEKPTLGGKQHQLQLNRWNKIWTIEKVGRNKYIIVSFNPKPLPTKLHKKYKYEINIGDKFSKLTILSPINSDERYKYNYLCQCECGNQTIVTAYSLIYGNTQSCGCIHKSTGKYIGKYQLNKERSKLTPSLRMSILKRDNFHCRLCGRGVEDGAKLEVDHIIPIAKGGLTEEENLWTLCFECNRGKSDNEI